MPSLKTRIAYQGIALAQADAALSAAASAVAGATTQLEDLQDGELDLVAIKLGGTRLEWDGTELVEAV
jgi:hypothetical protein